MSDDRKLRMSPKNLARENEEARRLQESVAAAGRELSRIENRYEELSLIAKRRNHNTRSLNKEYRLLEGERQRLREQLAKNKKALIVLLQRLQPMLPLPLQREDEPRTVSIQTTPKRSGTELKRKLLFSNPKTAKKRRVDEMKRVDLFNRAFAGNEYFENDPKAGPSNAYGASAPENQRRDLFNRAFDGNEYFENDPGAGPSNPNKSYASPPHRPYDSDSD